MKRLMHDPSAMLAADHYRELLRQAAVERLAKRLFKRPNSGISWMRVKIGKALIGLGLRLAPGVQVLVLPYSNSTDATTI
jgi:hypothetical protein